MVRLKDVAKIIEKYNIPSRDSYGLPTSDKRFPDGSHYKIEISGIEKPSTLEEMIDEMEKRNVPIHRIIITIMGATLYPVDELEKLYNLSKAAKLDVIVTPGPRRGWDTGVQYSTPEGGKTGGRIRGSDNLLYLIADIKRAIEIGFRGFLIWDEGVLWLLNEMRKAGEIPKDTILKLSVYAGHANPAGAKLIENLGADSFNPVGDLTLPMIASIRSVTNIPIDIYTYIFISFGGVNRFWEIPEIVRVAAPVYLKIEPGSSDQEYNPWTDEKFFAKLAREKVKYAEIMCDMIQKNYPSAITK